MKPYEIAACVHKMFTDHPEKFWQGEYFGPDGSFCTLGAAIFCVNPDVDIFDFDDVLPSEIVDFNNDFRCATGRYVDTVNDRDGLLAILKGLEKMIEEGLENEAN